MPTVKTMKFRLTRTHCRYNQVGHSCGDILWWIDNGGKIQTATFNGTNFHHDLDHRIDMDARWRGRLEIHTGRATLLPPIGVNPYYKDADVYIEIPRRLVAALKRRKAQTLMCSIDDRLWVIINKRKRR